VIVALCSALALVSGIAVAGKLQPAGFGDFRRGVGALWFGFSTAHVVAVARSALLLVSLEDLVALFRPAALPTRSGVRP
jgi:hypothetical protein